MKKASFNIVRYKPTAMIGSDNIDDYEVIKVDGYVTEDGIYGVNKTDYGWCITDLYSGGSITTLKRKQDCCIYLAKTKIPFERIQKWREFGHKILEKHYEENISKRGEDVTERYYLGE